MTYTYKFYTKAEQEGYDDIQSFEGASEKDIRNAVEEYCDTYGYEAYTLITESTTISNDDFETLVTECRAYDLFTQYIDDYKIQEQAEKRNTQAGKVFDEILYQHHIFDAWIGNFANKGEETAEKLRAFIESHDVKIEEAPKQKKQWTQEEIKSFIQTNDKCLYGALKKLYAEQTADEQRSGNTKERNNRGFNGTDSKFLTSVAQFLIKRGFLTDKQKVVTRKKLMKYAGQLTRLANA